MTTIEQPDGPASGTPWWRTGWRARLNLLVLVLCLAELVWLIFGWGGPEHQALIGDLTWLPWGLLQAVLAWNAGDTPAARRGWRLVALSMVAYWIGALIYDYYDLVLHVSGYSSWADAGYLAFYAFMVPALLSFSGQRPTPAQWVRGLLDIAVVALASVMAVWYFIMTPILGQSMAWLPKALALAYPVGDIVLLGGVCMVMFKLRGTARVGGMRLLGLSMVIFIFADLVYCYRAVTGRSLTGNWDDLLYFLAFTVCGLAAQAACAPPDGNARSADSASPTPLIAALPYTGALAGLGLFIWIAVRGPAEQMPLMATGSVALTLMVSVRQILVLRENDGLLRAGRQLTEEIRRSEARFRSLVHSAFDVIAVIGADGRPTFLTDSAEQVTGYTARELVRMPLKRLAHPADLAGLAIPAPGARVHFDCRLRHRDGSWRQVEGTVTNLTDTEAVGGLVVNIRDVTDRKALEAQLRHQATHDALTGLPNAARFQDLLRDALSVRRGGGALAVLFLDMDGFKAVNDTMGHAVGDKLLCAIADRLVAAVGSQRTVARMGGDEYAVLIPGGDRARATQLAEAMIAAVAVPFQLGGQTAHLRVSIGIALCPGDGTTAPEILHSADVAMYAAKACGRGSYRLYSSDLQASFLQRSALKEDLRLALELRQLRVHYQPIVELRTGELAGMEALCRWIHPTLGQIPATEFIPLAEEAGLITAIDLWVMGQACRQFRRWQEQHPGGAPGRLNVNLSARDFTHPGLAVTIAGLLSETGMDPKRLTVEVTESLLMGRTEAAMLTLERLRALGVRVAFDDFGTGYSSLSYLRDFPVDAIKIDRSFVSGLSEGSTEMAMLRGLMDIVLALRLDATAEGVTTPAQAAELIRCGCRYGQGELYGSAMPPAECEATFTILQRTP